MLLYNPFYLPIQLLAVPHEGTGGKDGGGFAEYFYRSAFVLHHGVGFVRRNGERDVGSGGCVHFVAQAVLQFAAASSQYPALGGGLAEVGFLLRLAFSFLPPLPPILKSIPPAGRVAAFDLFPLMNTIITEALLPEVVFEVAYCLVTNLAGYPVLILPEIVPDIRDLYWV